MFSRQGSIQQCIKRLLFYSSIIRYSLAFLTAACTTWPTSTEVVTVPTPPGTGVMASTTGSCFAELYVTAQLALFVHMDAHVYHGLALTQAVGTHGTHLAHGTTTTSASLQMAGRFCVRELQMVTVAFSRSSIMAAGLPTTRLRPTTTARLPESGML